MARIPVYQRQIGVRAENISPVNLPTQSADQQMFMQGLNSFADAAVRLSKQQQAVKGTQYMTDFVNSQSALSKQLNDAQQQSKTGVDYIPAAQQIIKQHQEEFFTNHPDLSDQEKQDYTLRWAQSRAQLESQAINWGQGQAKQISVANLSDSAAAIGNTILQNPNSAKALAEAHLQAIDQSDLDPATKAELASRSRNTWALAAAQYGIQNNPQHVLDQHSTFQTVQTIGANAGEASPSGSSGTLATRNNNPLNIRVSNNNWNGKGADNGTGFEQFDTADHGFRAGLKLMKNHINNGADTLGALITKWAPPNENDTRQYAQTVSHKTGIPVDAKLNPNDPQQMTAIAKAMAAQEGYQGPISESQLQRAWTAIDDPDQLAPGVPWGQLTPQQALTITNQAQAKVDQQNTQRRILMQQQMQNDSALIENGKPVSNPITREQWLSTAPHDATPEQLTILDKQYQEYALLNQLQPVYSDINTKSASAGLESVQAIRPDGSEGDFAFRQQRYQQALQKYQQVMKARESDPGGWLVQNSPDVQAAFAAYQQDPTQGAALAQSIQVEKSRLGIKSKALLPDTLADGILQQIDTSKEQSVTAIQSIAQQFGPYAQNVMEQVQKKAGPALQVVMATENPRAANALWQNRNVKTADLRDAINTASTGAADSADSEWASQSKDFAATMAVQPGGVSVWNNFNDQGRRLTYLNIQKGMSPSDAAKQAYDDILGAQYQMKGTWRLPARSGLDIKDVSQGVDYLTENLKPSDITPLIGDPRISDEVNRQQSIERIKDNGEWITNSDESGLMLTLNGLVVNGADGNPITVPFSDLAKLGQQNRSFLSSVSKAISEPVTYTPGQSKNYTVESQRENILRTYQQGQSTGR
ncbi:Lytic transglycosylase, catalytic [Cronobacter dublinensis]|uniref:Lytic transglycosylase, catalytic n=1 Tax=Cronobacter dublinensis TaxID=413497 RepID=UPI0024AFC8C2|nr:Lytic transglycosylase, catalytic [Cronobacter dublinensis]MDI7502019.1 Lytic transglycosylase, catalytic [Cronobacter dublinensis]